MEDKLPSLLKKHPSDGKKKDGKSGADKHEADKHADEDKAIALFEKCLGEARSAPVEDKKVVVEAATFEKGMRDTRKNVKSLGM
jgi:pyridoxine/pyridoxamine 5'-phosphate oxidase